MLILSEYTIDPIFTAYFSVRRSYHFWRHEFYYISGKGRELYFRMANPTGEYGPGDYKPGFNPYE